MLKIATTEHTPRDKPIIHAFIHYRIKTVS
jgi:hypothetical protein